VHKLVIKETKVTGECTYEASSKPSSLESGTSFLPIVFEMEECSDFFNFRALVTDKLSSSKAWQNTCSVHTKSGGTL
jgi:hypothetical protein